MAYVLICKLVKEIKPANKKTGFGLKLLLCVTNMEEKANQIEHS